MRTATKIEWTRGDDGTAGATWNPVTGCSEVSEGCDRCDAKTFAERWRGVPGHPLEQGFEVRLWPDRLGSGTSPAEQWPLPTSGGRLGRNAEVGGGTAADWPRRRPWCGRRLRAAAGAAGPAAVAGNRAGLDHWRRERRPGIGPWTWTGHGRWVTSASRRASPSSASFSALRKPVAVALVAQGWWSWERRHGRGLMAVLGAT
jgi:Protein of unknown function (DUF5131)